MSSDGTQDDAPDRIVSEVQDLLKRLDAHGWTVEVHRSSHSEAIVTLSHPASSGIQVSANIVDPQLAMERIDNMVSGMRELAAIREAPEITHPSEVMEVRAMAAVHEWSEPEVRSVTRMLQARSLLAGEEVEWLLKWAPAPT